MLADLKRRGFTVHQLHRSCGCLATSSGTRLFEATGGGGQVELLTDGREIYARTRTGQFFNLLKTPAQPLLAIGNEGLLKELRGKVSRRKSESEKLEAKSSKSADREDLLEVVGRTRNDVHADELADAASRRGAGIGRRFHGARHRRGRWR